MIHTANYIKTITSAVKKILQNSSKVLVMERNKVTLLCVFFIVTGSKFLMPTTIQTNVIDPKINPASNPKLESKDIHDSLEVDC